MFSRLLVVFFALAANTAWAASYQICNRTAETLHLSYALLMTVYDPVFGSGSTSPVESQGWYNVEPGNCREFTFTQNNHSAYFFAKGSLGNVYAGSSGAFCSGQGGNAFRHTGRAVNVASNCAADGGTMVGHFLVRPGTFNFTDNSTYVRYCNRTAGIVFHSTVMFEQNRWMSRGWGRLNPSDCVVQNKGVYSGDLYIGGFYALNGQNHFWHGPTEFCVHSTNAFNYPFADSMTCESPNMRMGFFRVQARPGVNEFNFQD